MRRRVLLVLGSLVCLGLLGFVLSALLFRPPSSITHENCRRIEPGMRQPDVEAILGGPPGDYRTTAGTPESRSLRDFRTILQEQSPEGVLRQWDGDELTVLVIFDKEGLVFEALPYLNL